MTLDDFNREILGPQVKKFLEDKKMTAAEYIAHSDRVLAPHREVMREVRDDAIGKDSP